MKKNLFIIILSSLVLCGCGNNTEPEQPIAPTITEQAITPTVTKEPEQPMISPTEEPVATPTEVPVATPTATATPVLPTEVPEQKPTEKFAYTPEQLEGNWLLISNMVEGDITNVIPGYFESLIFQRGYYDNSEFSLTASMEAADTYGIVREAFYEYSIEVLEEPLYLDCENQEWCVQIGEEPALNEYGQSSEPAYYATLLDENTLLRQNYYNDSYGQFLSYQTYKRIAPMGSDTGISAAELEGSNWVMTGYVGEDGVVKNGDVFIHLDIYPECSIAWWDDAQKEEVVLDGFWFLGSNGNILLFGEDFETLWLPGAVFYDLTAENAQGEYGKGMQLYYDRGIVQLEYISGSGGEDFGGEENTVTYIDSTEALLEAIAPDSYIVVNSGYYNLSDYIENLWKQEGETWNQTHPYVQLRECFDGVELVIQNVHNMTITGDAESLPNTEIVVDPRYADVLCFENCSQINMNFLTMGHTDKGDCEGNVLSFYNCHDITLSAMDLYGCGVYGIGSYDGTGDLYVYSSTLRDCYNGPFEVLDGNGRFEFWNCVFTGSTGGGIYFATRESDMAFFECIFGERESNMWYFQEDVYKENCVWSEITEYPDYGYEEYWFDPDMMNLVPANEEVLKESYWGGYAMVDQGSGEMIYLPYEDMDTWIYASLEMKADYTGVLELGEKNICFTWKCDDENLVSLETEEGWYSYLSLYVMENDDEGVLWGMLQIQEDIIWFY